MRALKEEQEEENKANNGKIHVARSSNAKPLKVAVGNKLAVLRTVNITSTAPQPSQEVHVEMILFIIILCLASTFVSNFVPWNAQNHFTYFQNNHKQKSLYYVSIMIYARFNVNVIVSTIIHKIIGYLFILIFIYLSMLIE